MSSARRAVVAAPAPAWIYSRFVMNTLFGSST